MLSHFYSALPHTKRRASFFLKVLDYRISLLYIFNLFSSTLSFGVLPAAHIPLYLYPFLNTVSKNRPFEYLRLTSLGVIGALVKVIRIHVSSPYFSMSKCWCVELSSKSAQLDDSEVINFLLQTEIIPLCLRIMETGSELSKTVNQCTLSTLL
jgi:hypothetical protein